MNPRTRVLTSWITIPALILVFTYMEGPITIALAFLITAVANVIIRHGLRPPFPHPLTGAPRWLKIALPISFVLFAMSFSALLLLDDFLKTFAILFLITSCLFLGTLVIDVLLFLYRDVKMLITNRIDQT